MLSWLKFYFLGFFNDKYGKEAATRSMLNVLLCLLITLLLLSGGISAGYSASFGSHYSNADEFRSFLYSDFAAESVSRINLEIQDGRLSADRRVNTFKDGGNGYKLIVDTHSAETAFDDFTLICKDANGVEISYENYLKLPEEGKKNGSVTFEYSGNPLDVTVKQAEYTEYLDRLSDETGKQYNGEVASAYGELKHKKSTGEISEEEYANGIYALYAKTYYPSYSDVEIYGEAPTLRTYYMQAKLTEGEEKFLILLDDVCICAFKTENGIAVDFGSYYTGIADTVISADGMTVNEMQKNVDSFINKCFTGSGAFNFLVHFMNMGKSVLLLILVMLVLSLIVFVLCRTLHLEFGSKYFGTVKIVGAYLLYSGLAAFLLAIILSFFYSRGTVFIITEAVAISVLALRTAALLIAEFIRNKSGKSDVEKPSEAV